MLKELEVVTLKKDMPLFFIEFGDKITPTDEFIKAGSHAYVQNIADVSGTPHYVFKLFGKDGGYRDTRWLTILDSRIEDIWVETTGRFLTCKCPTCEAGKKHE